MEFEALLGGKEEAAERRKAFEAGQAVTRDEYAAELIEASIEAHKRIFRALMGGMEAIKEFDASTPMNAMLIEAYKEGVLGFSSALARGDRTPESLAAPFSEGLNGASSSSARVDRSVSPERSIPDNQPLSLPEPRKGPGRPKGTKNKGSSERNGKPHSEPGETNGRH